MSKLGMVSVLVLTLAGSARLAHANDWTELGSDREHTRSSSEISGPRFSAAWSYTLGSGQIVATPVSSGGSVIVAGSDGVVAALKATDGTLLWSRSFEGGVRATPTVSGDQVAVSTMAGQLVSLNLLDGGIAWQRAFGGQNYSSPQRVVADAATGVPTLVVGAGFPSQDMWRFNAVTGEPVWQSAKGAFAGLLYSTAAVAGDHLVMGMNGGRFQSLDLATGTVGWTFNASGQVYLSSPLVVGGRVYMFPGDAASQLYAVDSSTGAPIPGFPVAIPDLMPVAGGSMLGQGPAVSSPMTIGGLIVVEVRRNDRTPADGSLAVVMRESVVAIDPVTARVVWQHAVSSVTAPNSNGVPELSACPTPAGFSDASGDYVVVSSSIAGRVAVLDARTGLELWSSALSSPGRSSPVFSNGQLLIATDDGVLHAFSSSTNQAPSPPTRIGPSGEQTFSAAGTSLNWDGATDLEAGALSYVVRFEKEGSPETRADAQVAVGQTDVTLALEPNAAYVFSVRSRDAQGALSAWSSPQRIQVGAEMPVTIAALPAVVMASSPPAATPPAATPPAITPAAATPASTPLAAAMSASMASSMPTALDEQGGCSVSGGRGSGSAGALVIGVLALCLRARRAKARRASSGVNANTDV